MNKKAYILFTRIPTVGKVKTRLAKTLGDQFATEVQAVMLEDLYQHFSDLSKSGIDLFIAYSDEQAPEAFLKQLPPSSHSFLQSGKTIGERMWRAMNHVFALGYEKVILTGSDLPELSKELIEQAFKQLKEVVIGPSKDGGYYLIGSCRNVDLKPIFLSDLQWGRNSVLAETLLLLKNYQVSQVEALQDIDEEKDLREVSRSLSKASQLKKWLVENGENK
ncbi:TIGR04282 family arsenosugar biosynthesis glycosyltransferase [Enterococcus alishanensis]|uniref:TIGR04282 family arsenosugar biosynthesis glycosyltransferase n=1 Tax=Enterococcus alishanensis TaxID=1303817 RepID=A0ABS6TFC8_9ENTE|nr:TIGR04282 family arsenosugar biosynthesis glycosyltransferase [Enterococcus alishanensis]MBV7391625.1 TIGR04282 family arsenosugar biosynthesis glycosyltransferase [Enterococcus alishanensis]